MDTRFWPQLDGLRVVSILIVFISHMGDAWLAPFEGGLGVIIFFVISGFLITSLLIREERLKGRVSIQRFYVRRVFRIVPLYMLALGATALLVALGLGVGSGDFWQRLPWLLTFNGDFVAYGTFVHSWSIGIEEKFYLVWPLLAFSAGAIVRARVWTAIALVLFCSIAAYVPPIGYFGTYTAIALGCVMSIAMHSGRTFDALRAVAGGWWTGIFTALAIAAFLLDGASPFTGAGHIPFAVAVTLVFPALILGNGWLSRALSWGPLAHIGKRTYAIYLFHVFAIDVVNIAIPAGATSAPLGMLRLGLALGLTYLVAEVLYFTVEQPMIRLGRRFTHSKIDPGKMPVSGQNSPSTERN